MTAAADAGVRLLDLEGGPFDLGLQHGRALGEEIHQFKGILEEQILYARGRLVGRAFRLLVVAIARQMERYLPPSSREELRGLVRGAHLSWDDGLLFNCFDDIVNNLRPLGAAVARFACSAYAVGPPLVAEDEVLCGRNLDYYFLAALPGQEDAVARTLREHVVVFRVRPAQGLPFISVGWPGMIGCFTALNEMGLFLACLTVVARENTIFGTPCPILYRQIAQHCAGSGEAVVRLRWARRTIGNNLLLAGADGARVLEFTSRRLAQRQPRDGWIAATNHFLAPAMQACQRGLVVCHSEHRLNRLGALVGGRAVDEPGAQRALLDTASLAADGSPYSRLRNPGTTYSVVARPRARRLLVRVNDRPERDWVEVASEFLGGVAAPPRAGGLAVQGVA